MGTGAFCLVLHGHLPWVLHHGRWPHGEDWLYEAVSATWLPLLSALDQAASEGIRPAWTVGMMPILLEQLAHPRAHGGFIDWTTERLERARSDQAEFHARGDGHLAWLASEHERRCSEQLVQFEAVSRNPATRLGELARSGQIEMLSSNATHGFHPLILHDACARAQIRAGLAASERHLGHRPAGVWLPECAYRPAGPWVPPAVHGDSRDRAGVGTLFADAGVRFFFVDQSLIAGLSSQAVIEDGRLVPVDPSDAEWDSKRGWRSPLEPVRVSEAGAALPICAIGRHPEVSERVWSADHGYPGDGRYLEFHKKHGMRGLPYWKVTGSSVDLGDKQPYYPHEAHDAACAHAEHFVGMVADQLRQHRDHTGRYGVVTAPFDAELFGHWWSEGPIFLLEVLRRMHAHPDIDLCTVSEALERAPADKVAALPEGTWGAGGDHRVWLHEGLRFYWEAEYHAEDRFMDLWHRVDWRAHEGCRELLQEAARQLLLLQASDWPFVITTEGAIDYGMRRILEHAARFDDLCNGVEDRWAGRPTDGVALEALRWCRFTDPVFPDLDLAWWS